MHLVCAKTCRPVAGVLRDCHTWRPFCIVQTGWGWSEKVLCEQFVKFLLGSQESLMNFCSEYAVEWFLNFLCKGAHEWYLGSRSGCAPLASLCILSFKILLTLKVTWSMSKWILEDVHSWHLRNIGNHLPADVVSQPMRQHFEDEYALLTWQLLSWASIQHFQPWRQSHNTAETLVLFCESAWYGIVENCDSTSPTLLPFISQSNFLLQLGNCVNSSIIADGALLCCRCF